MEQNYYLREKICPKCGQSKAIIFFSISRNTCKDCINLERKRVNRQMGAQDRKQAKYNVFNLRKKNGE